MTAKMTEYGAAQKNALIEPYNAEDIAYRPSIMVDDITQSGIGHGIYGIEQSNIAFTDPARLALLAQLHSRVTPHSRIEVMVFDEQNNLQEAFVEKADNFGDRSYCSVRKQQDAQQQFTRIFNQYTESIGAHPMSPEETAVGELYYDDRVIDYVQNF